MGVSIPLLGVPGLMGGTLEYYQRLLKTEQSNLLGLWRLNESSGLTIEDANVHNYDGVYVNTPALATYIGPDGDVAPLFDASQNEYGNVYSAALEAAFNGAEGTMIIWYKPAGAGVWSDGTNRVIFLAYANGSNYVRLRKFGDDTLDWLYQAGGTPSLVQKTGVSGTDWVLLCLTWSKSNDRVRAFFGGIQEGVDQTSLGTWINTPSKLNIGANETGGATWNGGLALAALWSKELSPDQISLLAAPD